MHQLEWRYREIADMWCAQDWDRWVTTASVDYSFDPGAGPVRDLAQTLEWSRSAFAAFPDFRQVIQYVIVGERTVTGLTLATGTFTGPLDTAHGPLPPNGLRFTLPFVKVLELDDDGRVRRDWQFMDYARMTNGNQPPSDI